MLYLLNFSNLTLRQVIVANCAGNGIEVAATGTGTGGNLGYVDRFTCDNCWATMNGNDGLYIHGGSNYAVQNVDIRNSQFDSNGNLNNFSAYRGAGLHLGGTIWALFVETTNLQRNDAQGQVLVNTGSSITGCNFMGDYFETDSSTGNVNGYINANWIYPAGSLNACGYWNSANPVNTLVPTVSGFGTTPTLVHYQYLPNMVTLTINVGTGGTATTGTVALTPGGVKPAAPNGWMGSCSDITTQSATVFSTLQTATTTSSFTIGNFNNTGVAAAWNSGDILQCVATPY
jgi:hypothetical protein